MTIYRRNEPEEDDEPSNVLFWIAVLLCIFLASGIAGFFFTLLSLLLK